METPFSLVNDRVDELGQPAPLAHGYISSKEGEDDFAIDGRHLLERRARTSVLQYRAHRHRRKPLRIQHIKVEIQPAVRPVDRPDKSLRLAANDPIRFIVGFGRD